MTKEYSIHEYQERAHRRCDMSTEREVGAHTGDVYYVVLLVPQLAIQQHVPHVSKKVRS